jgi:hypothetical protein
VQPRLGQAQAAVDAGATYLVIPGCRQKVAEVVARAGCPGLPLVASGGVNSTNAPVSWPLEPTPYAPALK